jgi:hypothetical protein
MENNIDIFQKNLNNIVDESDFLELKQFTFDLLDCLYVDIVCEETQKVSKLVIEGYINEVKNSIEVFNPEYKLDIEILEKVLKELDFFLEFGS